MGLMNPDEEGDGFGKNMAEAFSGSGQTGIPAQLPQQAETAPTPAQIPPTPIPSYFAPTDTPIGPRMSDPGPPPPPASPLSTPAPQPNQSVGGLGGQQSSSFQPMVSALLGQGGMMGQQGQMQNPVSAGGFGMMKGFG